MQIDRETVILLAREAGLCTWTVVPDEKQEQFERFARAITQRAAEAEQARCARIAHDEYTMRNAAYIDKDRDSQERALAGIQAASSIYHAIRARGTKEASDGQ